MKLFPEENEVRVPFVVARNPDTTNSYSSGMEPRRYELLFVVTGVTTLRFGGFVFGFVRFLLPGARLAVASPPDLALP